MHQPANASLAPAPGGASAVSKRRLADVATRQAAGAMFALEAWLPVYRSHAPDLGAPRSECARAVRPTRAHAPGLCRSPALSIRAGPPRPMKLADNAHPLDSAQTGSPWPTRPLPRAAHPARAPLPYPPSFSAMTSAAAPPGLWARSAVEECSARLQEDHRPSRTPFGRAGKRDTAAATGMDPQEDTMSNAAAPPGLWARIAIGKCSARLQEEHTGRLGHRSDVL